METLDIELRARCCGLTFVAPLIGPLGSSEEGWSPLSTLVIRVLALKLHAFGWFGSLNVNFQSVLVLLCFRVQLKIIVLLPLFGLVARSPRPNLFLNGQHLSHGETRLNRIVNWQIVVIKAGFPLLLKSGNWQIVVIKAGFPLLLKSGNW